MTALFKNNAFSTLASGINDSVTSISLDSGDGAKFPSPSSPTYFYATLIDTSNNLEIVKCTARSTDVLTVTRAQESTTARAYSAGDRIEMRLTAAGLTANTDIAKDWATKVDGVAADSEYSAKAYAIGGTGVTDTAGKGAAKEWATEAEDNTVDGTNYSAKHWSAKASAHSTTAANEASAVAPKYTFSTTTSMADPGAGVLRYNHGTVASVTAIAIDDTTADTGNPDIAAWITSWDDSTSAIKGQLRLVEPGTPANYAVFNVTALTDNSGWVQLTVAHVDSNGTFSNTDSIRVSFARTGDKGSGEGIELIFESTTTDTDQGAGKVFLNHGTPSSATVVYIDDVDSNAVNINSYVDSFDDSTSTVKGRIVIKKQLAPENYHMFNVTGSVTSASTYSKVACTHVVSAGTISDGDAVFLSFSRTGDKGIQGVAGSDGDVSEATAVALAIALG